MSLPMITFSLSPRRRSTLPLIAASVSTRVVSWKDAADSHEVVFSAALIRPSSTVCAVAGSPPSASAFALPSSYSHCETISPGSRPVSPAESTRTFRIICRTMTSMCLSLMSTPWLRYTFWTSSTRKVCTASFPRMWSSSCGEIDPSVICWPAADLVRDRVLAHLLVERAHRDVLGRHRHLAGVPGLDGVALGVAGQLLALHDVVLALDGRGHLGVKRVGDLELLPGDHAHLSRALLTDDLELPVDLGDDGLALRDASLEELFDARKALGDVHAGHAAGVESAHGQLGAGLADRLGGDDAHRLPDLDDLAGGQVPPVARAADALASLAHEHGTHLDRDACGDDLARVLVGDRRAGGYEHLAADGDVLRRDPARDLLVNGVGLGPLRGDVADPDAVGGAAVLDAHDHVLRDVHEAARQVSGVGGAEGGVGKALARAVGRDEVLEHGEALGEVGYDGQVDDPARGVGHQATHARELADLLDVSAGPRAHHHPDRAELVEGLLGRVADPLVGVLPELDDLAIALVIGHDAAAVHPLDLGDFLLGAVDDLPLRVGVRDVHRRHGDPGLGGVAEPEPLDVVDDDCGGVAAVQAIQLRDQGAQQLAIEVRVLERQRLHRCFHRRLADGQ